MRATPKLTLHRDAILDAALELVDLGQNRLMPMVHLEIFEFTPSSYRHIRSILDDLRQQLPEIIYAQPIVDDPLFEKFVSRFGFKPISDGICADGVNRRIYVNIDGSDTAKTG